MWTSSSAAAASTTRASRVVATRAHERAVTERGAQTLAARRDEAAQRFDRFGQTIVDRTPAGELGRQQIVDPALDPDREGRQRRGKRRLLRPGRGHARKVVAAGRRNPNAEPEHVAVVRCAPCPCSCRRYGCVTSMPPCAARTVRRPLAPVVIEQVVRAVPGRGEVRYHFRVDAGGACVVEGAPPDPADVRLTTDYDTATAIALGKENAQSALAQGRLRLGGDIDTLVRGAAALAALDDATAALRAATTYPATIDVGRGHSRGTPALGHPAQCRRRPARGRGRRRARRILRRTRLARRRVPARARPSPGPRRAVVGVLAHPRGGRSRGGRAHRDAGAGERSDGRPARRDPAAARRRRGGHDRRLHVDDRRCIARALRPRRGRGAYRGRRPVRVVAAPAQRPRRARRRLLGPGTRAHVSSAGVGHRDRPRPCARSARRRRRCST